MNQHSYPIIVLISGNGTNLQAIIDAIDKGLPAQIRAVISNRDDAYGLERARLANIPTEVLPYKGFKDRVDYDLALEKLIDKYQPKLVVMAGFMRIIGPELVKHLRGRLINIHPSLLPKYRGLDTHQRVLAAGDKEHGVSIHFVTDDLDGGPIIAQAKIEIAPDDTPETLEAKIHKQEHILYPEVIRGFATGKYK